MKAALRTHKSEDHFARYMAKEEELISTLTESLLQLSQLRIIALEFHADKRDPSLCAEYDLGYPTLEEKIRFIVGM